MRYSTPATACLAILWPNVRACVVDTVAKLPWVDPGMFIWGGQAECESLTSLFVGMAFIMAIELLHMAADMWWYRHKKEKPRFSWVKLRWPLAAGFGEPVLKAYLLHRRSFQASIRTLVRVFLLTPRIAPVIGFLGPFFVGKSRGVQVLTYCFY
ncbi:hypothetical protein B0T24DRAFT_716373 [Lasiosphaeria ovina]|uniref:Wax synthase domain-containing protein n=1 Tax=Lasiosphaeria ovina TaxID=92902 RepID=A0AAE0NC83_9PEZI|nr:hypothetical protein B0T24DRAFT_716373 [Lasiosphaeria ovina]